MADKFGTSSQALKFAFEKSLFGQEEQANFLRDWFNGNVAAWPEYQTFLTEEEAKIRASAWVPMKEPVAVKHLTKLIEECNELGAAAARCLMQGIDEVEPTTDKPNRVWLSEEIADVVANIELNMAHFDLELAFIQLRKERKMRDLRAWHGMAT